jgi:hypothetical protein
MLNPIPVPSVNPIDDIAVESLSPIHFGLPYERLSDIKKQYLHTQIKIDQINNLGYFSYGCMLKCFQTGDDATREQLSNALPLSVKNSLINYFAVAGARRDRDEQQQQQQQPQQLFVSHVVGNVNLQNANSFGNLQRHDDPPPQNMMMMANRQQHHHHHQQQQPRNVMMVNPLQQNLQQQPQQNLQQQQQQQQNLQEQLDNEGKVEFCSCENPNPQSHCCATCGKIWKNNNNGLVCAHCNLNTDFELHWCRHCHKAHSPFFPDLKEAAQLLTALNTLILLAKDRATRILSKYFQKQIQIRIATLENDVKFYAERLAEQQQQPRQEGQQLLDDDGMNYAELLRLRQDLLNELKDDPQESIQKSIDEYKQANGFNSPGKLRAIIVEAQDENEEWTTYDHSVRLECT